MVAIFHRNTKLSGSSVSPVYIDWGNCRLAMLEMKLALGMFVWHFDARLKFEGQPPPTFVDAVVVLRGPLEIVVTAVEI